jgi:ribosome-associated protein
LTDSARHKAEIIVAAAMERKAEDPLLLKVDRLTTIADYFFLCSGRSTRQVQALAGHIVDRLRNVWGFKPLGVEGLTPGLWVLIDYGEVIVHLFHDPTRAQFDLEGLWHEAPRIDIDSMLGKLAKGKKSWPIQAETDEGANASAGTDPGEADWAEADDPEDASDMDAPADEAPTATRRKPVRTGRRKSTGA